jgi:hypothetical protein
MIHHLALGQNCNPIESKQQQDSMAYINLTFKVNSARETEPIKPLRQLINPIYCRASSLRLPRGLIFIAESTLSAQ